MSIIGENDNKTNNKTNDSNVNPELSSKTDWKYIIVTIPGSFQNSYNEELNKLNSKIMERTHSS